jgi:very-short-patch-repair endonuclease
MKVEASEFARRLRRRMTDAERKLWFELRDRRLMGLKFKRQVPRGGYIVDFLCVEAGLVVEVDGGQHAEERADHDRVRTAHLEHEGLKVLRFWNNDVLTNMEAVLTIIAEELPGRAKQRPDSLSPWGEGWGEGAAKND